MTERGDGVSKRGEQGRQTEDPKKIHTEFIKDLQSTHSGLTQEDLHRIHRQFTKDPHRLHRVPKGLTEDLQRTTEDPQRIRKGSSEDSRLDTVLCVGFMRILPSLVCQMSVLRGFLIDPTPKAYNELVVGKIWAPVASKPTRTSHPQLRREVVRMRRTSHC